MQGESSLDGMWTGRGLWRRWTIASTLGGTLAAVVATLLYALLNPWLPPIFSRMIAAAAAWSIVSAAQWPVLHVPLPDATFRAWVKANVTGALFGGTVLLIYAANDPMLLNGPASACLGGIIGVFCGIVMGSAQWWIINEHVRNAAPWIVSSFIGFPLGFHLGLYIAWGPVPLIFGWNQTLTLFISLFTLFLVNGAITGIGLVRVVRQEH
jgi:uncharacterized membrane protein